MIIAFTGSMGAGKSTAIKVLEQTGYTTQLVKFAAPIYDIQEYIYKRIESVYTRPADFVKNRTLLQYIGTDFGRSLSQSLWVDIWMEEVDNALTEIVVCDDCRFDNEAEAIKAMGGIIIKITSDKNVERITTANGIANHASEAGINPKFVDYTIENNGTLEEYENKLKSLYEKLLMRDTALSAHEKHECL